MELDSDYAARILLGALALSMTTDGFGSAHRREAQRLLTRMRRAARREDVDDWLDAHNAYHGMLEAGAPEPLRRQLRLLADRSVRYIRIRQYGEPVHWADAGDIEHPAILQCVAEGDCPAAVTALAHHLAGTALRVLADSAPDYVPTAVPRAVALVDKS